MLHIEQPNRFYRGLLFGMVLSMPMWVCIIAAVVMIFKGL